MPLVMEVGLGPGDIVLDRDPVTQKGARTAPPIIGPCLLWPNRWMDQDATWTWYEVDLVPGDIGRWGPSSPQPKGAQSSPMCGPCLLWPNGWMYQDATLYGGRPWPRPHCVRWGTQQPSFRSMSIVAKRSPMPATAEHLHYWK